LRIEDDYAGCRNLNSKQGYRAAEGLSKQSRQNVINCFRGRKMIFVRANADGDGPPCGVSETSRPRSPAHHPGNIVLTVTGCAPPLLGRLGQPFSARPEVPLDRLSKSVLETHLRIVTEVSSGAG